MSPIPSLGGVGLLRLPRRGRAGGDPKFRRRREYGGWRLAADGLDHDAALAVLRKRRQSLEAHRLHRDLHKLLASLDPESLEGSRRPAPS